MDLEILRAEIVNDPEQMGYAQHGQDYPAIADMLNSRPMIANPETQKQIPAQLSGVSLLALVTPDEGLHVFDRPMLLERVIMAIDDNNRAGIALLWRMLKLLLSPESIAKIEDMLAQTVPDPDYQAEIPGPSRADLLGIGTVTPSDVQQVI